MFDRVFHYKHYRQELETGPLSSYLNEIAHQLFERGHSRRKVRNKFVVLGQLSRWMRRRNIAASQLSEIEIQKFLRIEARRVVWSLSDRGDIASLKLLMKLLRDKMVISFPLKQNTPSTLLIDDFERHLSTERGLSRTTIYCYSRYSALFITEQFGDGVLKWIDVGPDDIRQFLLRRSQTFSPYTTKLIATSLRSFFRFLRYRGDVNVNLSSVVPSLPHWRATNLPYYLKSEELTILLRSIDRSNCIGKRDYAILMLLARLGLRACEVTLLSLDDLDWSNAEIIVQGKGVRGKRLPISQEVGSALTTYLKARRRACKTRKVFVRDFPPYTEMSRSNVGTIVRTALARANLKPYKSGSHLLRHTSATEMLRKGASLTEIGSILGHQRVESTAIYAKVDFSSLRSLTRPWPTSSCRGGAR